MNPRNLRRIWAALRSGFRGIRATSAAFSASVVTLTAGLILVGACILVALNLRGVLDELGADLEVTAFLVAPLEPAARGQLEARVAGFEGVSGVHFVSRDEALARLRRDLGRDSDVLDGLDDNPLPASLEVRLAPERRTPERARALAALLEREPAVKEVRYGAEWVAGYARLLRALAWLGIGLGGLVLGVLLAIVAGTIRLGVHARAEEIEIQRLVGAGGWFVRLPFCLEGALSGLLAAALAAAMLWGVFVAALPLWRGPFEFLLGRIEPRFFSPLELWLLLAAGAALGVGGALASLTRLDAQS